MSKWSQSFWGLAAVFCTVAGLSCSSNNGPSSGPKPAAGGTAGRAGEEVKIQGAGASFPAPLYNKWFKAYHAAHPDVQIDYQSVGSGSGREDVIKQDGRLRRQRRGHDARGNGQGGRRACSCCR